MSCNPRADALAFDILARLIGQRLTERWSQQVIVENRPGGGTVIETEHAAKSPPDGYMIHVPYKGAGPATVDLLSGQVSFMFVSILPTLPHVQSGRMRAIAVSGLKRSPILPQVPAVAETLPGFAASS